MEFYNPNTLGIHEIDAQRDYRFISNMNMNRSPPSPHPSPPFPSFPSSPFNSPTHDPLVAPIWYSRSFDRFGSPIIDSSAKFHQILLQNQRGCVSPSCSSPSSSSRGSLSPLTSIENLETPPSRSPPVKYATPVKVEEDVLVMDGILVKSSLGSGSGGGGNGNRSKSILDSGLSPLRSRYSSNKSELCHAWESTKTCPYGSKCQFAHGKEDVRPNRQNSTKSKSDVVACKTFNTTGSCAYGAKCRFGHYETGVVARRIINKVLVAKEQEKGKAIARASSIDQDLQTVVWSPMDDNIPLYKMPSSTAEPRLLDDKEQLEAHMKSILHGPPLLKRRLPVFREIYSAD